MVDTAPPTVSCVFVATLGMVALVGCQEVTSPNTAPLTLFLFEFVSPGQRGPPLEGVQVCETDTDNCEVSSSIGLATIELPVDRESSYTLEKVGYAPYLVPIVVSEDGAEYDFQMVTEQFIAEQYDRLMSPYLSDRAGNVGFLLNVPLAGATFDLIDGMGKAYYEDEEGRWSADLISTTSTGEGGFVEVGPGEYEAAYGGAAKGCAANLKLGWPGNSDNSIRFPVRAGHRTLAEFTCPPP